VTKRVSGRIFRSFEKVPSSLSRSMKPLGVPVGFRRVASSLCNPALGAARRARHGGLMHSVVLRSCVNTVRLVVAGLIVASAALRMPVDIVPEIDVPVDF
jgi:hypothetical protein